MSLSKREGVTFVGAYGIRPFFFLALWFVLALSVQADVVKPALIEISAYKGGRVSIEIRASIEALLTGINSQYKNT